MQTIIGRFATAEDAGQAIGVLQTYQPSGAQARQGISRQARMELGVVIGIIVGLSAGYLFSPGMPSGGVLVNVPNTHLNLVLGFVLGVQGGLALGLLLSALPLQARPVVRVSRVRHHATTLTIQTRNKYSAELIDALRAAGAVKVHTLRGAFGSDAVGAALDMQVGSQVGFRTV